MMSDSADARKFEKKTTVLDVPIPMNLRGAQGKCLILLSQLECPIFIHFSLYRTPCHCPIHRKSRSWKDGIHFTYKERKPTAGRTNIQCIKIKMASMHILISITLDQNYGSTFRFYFSRKYS
jgi:hypothetical protein